ncbi:exodeoxyribonuclease VII large subunit [Friedmanniella endophytica]|uniref:Exodeoxyribonuclease 7 large subunit n=1 Tax=Microlunatus kandeliicorticis TaxID=1759536 RepID=A0A7W3ISN2_9ACTN|nr:exodeoxyribonuclease VII large subunit [Microlunatus kandeliicorticis]MBA8794528.1 exodeoxyribonuclease VII large subunit [Microlunatus kandeliicorticis]
MPLESSPESPQPLRVVAHNVKLWIERLGWVWVEGQLIEINRRSGARTVFLTLRDKLAEVSASVAVSPATLDLAGPLTEGATVAVRLKPSYYAPSGRFSFFCDEIRPVGEGRLLARLEQTKRLLQAEGLFDRVRKKPLPFLPRAVGLITGAASAAERDVIENARRRWPAVTIVAQNTLVQGPQAAEEIITALGRLDAAAEIDVIVIARGGGSLEDLLPFSDEGLIRAVAACRTPVVSAIGHESDTPILDLVADVRASTPTDAARRIVPDLTEERRRVDEASGRLRQAIERRLSRAEDDLRTLRSRPVLSAPLAGIDLWHEQVDALRHRASRAIDHRIRQESSTVEHTIARVRALSPKATLERGYVILTDAAGTGISSAEQVELDDRLTAHLARGRLELTVRSRET